MLINRNQQLICSARWMNMISMCKNVDINSRRKGNKLKHPIWKAFAKQELKGILMCSVLLLWVPRVWPCQADELDVDHMLDPRRWSLHTGEGWWVYFRLSPALTNIFDYNTSTLCFIFPHLREHPSCQPFLQPFEKRLRIPEPRHVNMTHAHTYTNSWDPCPKFPSRSFPRYRL